MENITKKNPKDVVPEKGVDEVRRRPETGKNTKVVSEPVKGGVLRSRMPEKGKQTDGESSATSSRPLPQRQKKTGAARRSERRRKQAEGQKAGETTDYKSCLASSSSSSEEESDVTRMPPPPKPPSKAAQLSAFVEEPKRGRGRPPTTGEYVGLAKAKQAYIDAQRIELQLNSENEILCHAQDMTRRREARKKAAPAPSPNCPNAKLDHALGLHNQILECMAVVTGVAKSSKNLKGTFQKALKEAAIYTQEAAEELLGRTATQEVAMLRAANSRMTAEIADLRAELVSIRTELSRPRGAPTSPPKPPQPPPQERDAGDIFAFIDRKFAAFEERFNLARSTGILEPVQSPRSPAPRVSATYSQGPQSAQGPPETDFPLLGSRRRPSEGKTLAVDAPTPAPQPERTMIAPMRNTAEEGWAEVVGRKKARKARKAGATQPNPPVGAPVARTAKPGGKGSQQQQRPATKSDKPKRPSRIRPPNSSVVVLTLRPEASEKGISMGDLLAKAKEEIKLEDVGITTGVRPKRARTGARMIVIPGRDSGPLADALANKMREVLDEEVVKISRPVKTVSLRVSGLAENTLAYQVASAIATTTGCEVAHIRSSAIHMGPDGFGYTVVAVPVVAANKLKETKLRVGWDLVAVKPLPPRQLRCYRCHEPGHVAAKCTAVEDRSELCLRCGQAGHKVTAPCTAQPHCFVCEVASRPATHMLGGGRCGAKQPTKPKGKGMKKPPKKKEVEKGREEEGTEKETMEKETETETETVEAAAKPQVQLQPAPRPEEAGEDTTNNGLPP